MPLNQFLANRGYAVVQIAPRGALYTQRYYDAGVGEIAGKIGEDIVDATKWVANQKFSDKTKIPPSHKNIQTIESPHISHSLNWSL